MLKRTIDPKKGVGPNATTLSATLGHFEGIAASALAAAPAYRRSLDALGGGARSAMVARLVAALSSIAERKTTYVSLGEPPGHDAEYAAHVLGVIRAELYGIDDDATVGACPVCQRQSQLGANALRGAKINFLNADNHGFFAGFDVDRAGDRFSLCAACADAIATTYINRKNELRVVVAGAPALVLPYVVAPGAAPEASRSALDVLAKARAHQRTDAAEADLLDALAEEASLASFHVLWATAGDSLDEVTGFITDVPCTRLGTLSTQIKAANQWSGGMLPARRVRPLDLRLSLVGAVFEHPGGKRVERRNGLRLAALRKQIARAVYLGARLDPAPLLREVRDIIADHLVDPTVDERFVALDLTREPPPPRKAGADPRLNAASWVRHVALLFHYLRTLEVLPPMTTQPRFVPRSERLAALLGPASGVDSDAKLFAFLVGVLFGRLLAIQSARGVNVRSNALVWLRRATLTGAELPGLYVRIRQKFAEYEAERSAALREVVFDASAIGARLGTTVPLDADTTMYFLFLGQALAGEVFSRDDVAPTSSEP